MGIRTLAGEDLAVTLISIVYRDDEGNEVKYGSPVSGLDDALGLLEGHVQQVREGLH